MTTNTTTPRAVATQMNQSLPSDVKATYIHHERPGTYTASVHRDDHEVTRVYTIDATDNDPILRVTETGQYKDEVVYDRVLPSVDLHPTDQPGHLLTDLAGVQVTPREFAQLNGFDEAAHRLGAGFEQAVERYGDPETYYDLQADEVPGVG